MTGPSDSVAAGKPSAHSVSVIIPTNRGGPYLREAVESVRAQTRPTHEIILVDDGSPDPGLALVARTLGIAYVRQVAAGISAARNAGVAASTGRWVAFLDDDDVWEPRRLERQLAAVERHPHAIASYSGGWYMNSLGERFGVDWTAPPATSEEMLAGAITFPRITTLLVTRKAYDFVGGCDGRFEPSEDNELILRLLQSGEFVEVDEPLVGYRRHDANVTSRTLRGRKASRRALLANRRRLRARHDRRGAQLISSNLRVFRRNAAAENFGDVIDAARRHDWSYAAAAAWWGVWALPADSAVAVWQRLTRRMEKTQWNAGA